MQHCGDLRNVCVGLYAQSVLALVCFLRIVSVDPVRVGPVGVLLCEAAYGGGVVSCAEVVGAGLSVVVLAAVPERIGVVRIRCGLVAERVIGVGFVSTIHAGWRQYYDIPVRVVEVVLRAGCCLTGDQVRAAQISGKLSVYPFRDDIATIGQVGGDIFANDFCGTDPIRVVRIRCGDSCDLQLRKLSETVIFVGNIAVSGRCRISAPKVPVCVVGIGEYYIACAVKRLIKSV